MQTLKKISRKLSLLRSSGSGSKNLGPDGLYQEDLHHYILCTFVNLSVIEAWIKGTVKPPLDGYLRDFFKSPTLRRCPP